MNETQNLQLGDIVNCQFDSVGIVVEKTNIPWGFNTIVEIIIPNKILYGLGERIECKEENLTLVSNNELINIKNRIRQELLLSESICEYYRMLIKFKGLK